MMRWISLWRTPDRSSTVLKSQRCVICGNEKSAVYVIYEDGVRFAARIGLVSNLGGLDEDQNELVERVWCQQCGILYHEESICA